MKTLWFPLLSGTEDVSFAVYSSPLAERTSVPAIEHDATGWFYALFPAEITGQQLVDIVVGSSEPIKTVASMPADGGAAYIGAAAAPQTLLSPVFSNTRRLMNPSRLEARTRESRRHRVPIYSDKQPVDLRDKQLQFALQLVATTVSVDAFEIEGEHFNYACFVVPKTAHATAGSFPFAIRDLAELDGEEALTWAEGEYVIEDVPGPVTA